MFYPPPPPPPPPPQYESTYPAYPDTDYEGIPYAEPAKEVGDLYDQLAQEKCIEIPRSLLKWVPRASSAIDMHAVVLLSAHPSALRAEAVLGEGEFGEVFKGTWETPYGPQKVAIKMLKEGSTDKEKATFLQEAAIMVQFRHPHIVRLQGVITVDEPVSAHCVPLAFAFTDFQRLSTRGIFHGACM